MSRTVKDSYYAEKLHSRLLVRNGFICFDDDLTMRIQDRYCYSSIWDKMSAHVKNIYCDKYTHSLTDDYFVAICPCCGYKSIKDSKLLNHSEWSERLIKADLNDVDYRECCSVNCKRMIRLAAYMFDWRNGRSYNTYSRRFGCFPSMLLACISNHKTRIRRNGVRGCFSWS